MINSNVDASGRRMSDDGHVAGWGKDLTYLNPGPPPTNPTCIEHALYWESPASPHTDLQQYLPATQAGNRCRAEGVNNGAFPSVVGWDEDIFEAMLWERQSNGTWTALNLNSTAAIGGASSRWLITQAHDINDSGWIVAIAKDTSTSPQIRHAVLLAPYVACLGDLNYDSVVNVDDLVIVILEWGACPQPCPPNCLGDIAQNCAVDVDDLVTVILNWGMCPIVSTTQEGAPMDVEDCYEQALAAYPDTSGPKFIEAFDACVESLCRRELIDCD